MLSPSCGEPSAGPGLVDVRDARSWSRLEVKQPGRMTTTTGAGLGIGIGIGIGEVSQRTGLSVHTLRFYEKEGLFIEPVRRDGGGRRVFSEQDVGWLLVCSKLRSSTVPLPQIRRYAELARGGPSTVQERLTILREHEARVRAQLADLQDALSTIEAKVALYTDHLAAQTADRLWLDGPGCAGPTTGR